MLSSTAVVTVSDLTARGTVRTPIYNPLLSWFLVMFIDYMGKFCNSTNNEIQHVHKSKLLFIQLQGF